jgi:hypothetical protein
MPSVGLPVGYRITKTWRSQTYTVEVQGGLIRVENVTSGVLLGRYNSMTAAAHAVRGDNQSVNGWAFFGIVNPNRRSHAQTPQRTPTPPPAPRSPHPPGHRPPRPRRAALHVPQHPALRVAEDVGSDYGILVTHADRELVNRLARWLDRQLGQYQAERDEAERLDRVLGGEGNILGDLIAESRKVGTTATYSAEGGFRTTS